ncbi:MAG: putative rane protein [Dehalococcoidales bacterium]|nr:putative rane protein [Dehalococcoidales bacterium]
MYQALTTRHIVGRLTLSGLLALAGIAGPILLLTADVLAARSASSNNYFLIRDSISILAWMPMGWIQTIGFLAIGLLVEVFTAGLFLGIKGGRSFGFGIVLLVCFGFGLLLIGAFHTDVPGRPSTIDGTIHEAVANTVFWLLPVASLLIAPSLKKDTYWRPLFTYSIATALVTLVWIFIYKIWLPADLGWFGLYERILVVAEVLWVEVMAIWLLRLSLRE